MKKPALLLLIMTATPALACKNSSDELISSEAWSVEIKPRVNKVYFESRNQPSIAFSKLDEFRKTIKNIDPDSTIFDVLTLFRNNQVTFGVSSCNINEDPREYKLRSIGFL